MKLKRYLTIYAALWKNSVVREMGFKTNFLLWIVVEMLWFALQLSFFAVIYTHTDRIGTWSKWQVVMLLGASHFIQQIFTAIFLTNCTQLSELIRTGKLDFMLLLPVNTRFMISFRQVDLGGLVKAFFTFALPMLLIANVPARLLVRKLGSPFDMLLLLGMAVVCLLVSEGIWRLSVRHYTSASS